ncbi:fructose-1-phosphate kinase [Alkalibaculum bacchi]|mgnify:FL=1|jgi:1-phosphofructokinase|uniref:Tagatose-6-phosphate kinase n=1 Tax=Alkalibaculum bacchi TaxID=645887 RepID=A0A366HY07_9FIRM|nr:fructose-1-phosphate kinase [Alkalibaculum bacchi]
MKGATLLIITVTLNPAIDKTIYLKNYHHGQVNIIDKTILDPGGKGINVSKVLNSFSCSYISLGFTGGMDGKILEQHLSDAGIQYKFTPVKANTRTNTKMIESSTGKTTDLNEQGDEISLEELNRFIDGYREIVKDGDTVVLSGSAPKGIPQNIYYQLCEIALQVGAKVILDSKGPLLKEALKSSVFLIKPNVEELESLSEKPFDHFDEIVDYCNELISNNVEYICLSMGSEGALLIGKDLFLQAKVPTVEAKSTVGAGDSLLGAMIGYLSSGYSMKESFAYGVSASVLAVSKEGTKAPTMDEIEEFVHKIKIIDMKVKK